MSVPGASPITGEEIMAGRRGGRVGRRGYERDFHLL